MYQSVNLSIIHKEEPMITNEYLKKVYADVEKRDAHEPEFLQAVR